MAAAFRVCWLLYACWGFSLASRTIHSGVVRQRRRSMEGLRDCPAGRHSVPSIGSTPSLTPVAARLLPSPRQPQRVR